MKKTFLSLLLFAAIFTYSTLPAFAKFSDTSTPTVAHLLPITPAETEPAAGPFITYIPVIFDQPPAPPPAGYQPEPRLFCSSEQIPIPATEKSSVASIIKIEDDLRLIYDLDVRVEIDHTWVGDLSLRLTHLETGRSMLLMDRPGRTDTGDGCSEDNVAAIFNDNASSPVEPKCARFYPAISGIYQPFEPLHSWKDESILGTWALEVIDQSRNDGGKIVSWCLQPDLTAYTLPAPPNPVPTELPNQASVGPIYGERQKLPLDCESRSAVDWARYFGKYIDELDFFYSLPDTNHPDTGFVGNVYGEWGQLPPNPYGVHAAPVAKELRDRGLSAYAKQELHWDEVKKEIAAGRPVIAWIVGDLINGTYTYVVNGVPEYYFPSQGGLTTVARYEHTVVITGYSKTDVYFLNGATIYSKPLEQFLDSWSVLGNMAITARP